MYERINKRRNESRFFPNSVYHDDTPPPIPTNSSLPLLQSRQAVFHGSPREEEVDKILVNWQHREKEEGGRGVRRGGEKGREHQKSGRSSWVKQREGEQRKRYTLKEGATVGLMRIQALEKLS